MDEERLLVVPGLLQFTGAVKRDPAIATWFAAQPDDLRALSKPWFDRMRRCGPDVRELMHDGLATVCAGDVPFAYVGVFTAHVNVGFFHGATLPILGVVASIAAALYFWVQSVRHRGPEVGPFSPKLLSEDGFTDEGRRYRTRYYQAVVAAFLFALIGIALLGEW